MKQLFRFIVVISTLLYVIFWFLPYVDYLWLTEYEIELASAEGYGGYIPQSLVLAWAQLIIWVVISVGLFFFIPLARTAFVLMLVITAITNFLWGFLVMEPISAGLISIITTSDGVILTMMYLTSLSKYFEKSA